MTHYTLEQLGWRNEFLQQLDDPAQFERKPVRVVGVQRSGWQVLGEEIDRQIDPVITGDERPVAVGDWLLLDEDNQRATLRFERKSEFKRRAAGTDRTEQLIAANIDTVFIVSSCNQDFNEARLERYLALAHEAQVMPVVVLTKADLVDDTATLVGRASGLAPGLVVEAVNALDADSVQCLLPWLSHGDTIALLGSSGVGKSTLTNTLIGRDDIATQTVRADDDKGRHTTTSRHMYRLQTGAWVIDSPGMRELQLVDVADGIDDVFAEVSALAANCRFVDCAHESEPGCAVQAAVTAGDIENDRVERWRKLLREEAMNRETIAERRARGKATGKFYKSVLSESHHRKGRR